MALTIRPYDPSDLARRAALEMLTWPGYAQTKQDLEIEDAAWPESSPLRRFTALRDGEIVGVLAWYEPYWSKAPGRYQISTVMEPADPDLRGATEFILDDLLQQEPDEIIGFGRTDLPRRVQMLADLGFTEQERSPASRLDPSKFDAAPFAPLIVKLRSEGLRLIDFETLEREGYDWKQPLYDSLVEMVADIPTKDGMTLEPYEDYLKTLDPFDYTPGLMFAAMEGDRIVGYSRIMRFRGDEAHGFTAFGGIVRSHRRRGLMTALKAISIPVARDRYGITQISTDNVETNPMWEINRALGFELWFEIVKMKRARNV